MRALVTLDAAAAGTTLAGGAAMVAPCDPVYEAATVIGAVLRLRPAAGPGFSWSQPAGTQAGRPLASEWQRTIPLRRCRRIAWSSQRTGPALVLGTLWSKNQGRRATPLEWCTTRCFGRRLIAAITKASVTSSAVAEVPIDQPSTRRDQRSSTAAK